MSAHGKGGTHHYYACTASQKYGPKACNGERIPRHKLETAVLRQLTGIYRDGPLITDAIATATSIWKRINLVNLHENILPTRQRADLILTKQKNHTVQEVALRKL